MTLGPLHYLFTLSGHYRVVLYSNVIPSVYFSGSHITLSTRRPSGAPTFFGTPAFVSEREESRNTVTIMYFLDSSAFSIIYVALIFAIGYSLSSLSLPYLR